ncbi:hypothetical protein WL40_02025 [Burkholderia ubonensis]|uniref:Flagellar basal body rod protein FlgB n=2 Tax=Burkholderia ubonensis TaxID=101571 RepID=A0ABD6Q702_9BURK|nr:hypothetical protein WI74_02395 [Burkholderia ubonensis]KVO18855.1 hypothetical protein WJ72_06420 [Burkholderia ubonensis]KVO19560.1 hypothetical protein WJ74_05610 [Burkholderia ubonensis]KVO33821.1 hypothetical protein WJ76_14440 [Burkholderia ubonensis]KVP19074.1 hypothetical protein WJ85_08445 [Burkholderia ubonensis]
MKEEQVMSTEWVAAIAGKAMDGLYARSAALAHNVANANSAGFSPLRVTFEDALSDAAAARPGDTAATRRERVEAVRPQTVASPDTVRLDREIADASQASARYALLAGVLARTLQLRQLAVRGG